MRHCLGLLVIDKISALEGNDKIFAGWGHDNVFGDVKNVSLDFISQSTISPTIYDSTSAVHMLIPNFGNDKIFGGWGHDKLYGDAKNFDITIEAPDNVAAGVDASVKAEDLNVTFGNDKLFGGVG